MNTAENAVEMSSGISDTILRRLTVYHHYLSELAQWNEERISSFELAGKVGISASQIRKDLNLFGSFGQQGYGYRVDELLHELSKILGLTQKISMVMVGAGNLGRAITYYPGFQSEHFQIKAIFDSDPLVIGDSINQCIVRSLLELPGYLKSNPTSIGIISTSDRNAQEAADILIDGGIRVFGTALISS
jgi:redox-sensing transcriptional repressor